MFAVSDVSSDGIPQMLPVQTPARFWSAAAWSTSGFGRHGPPFRSTCFLLCAVTLAFVVVLSAWGAHGFRVMEIHQTGAIFVGLLLFLGILATLRFLYAKYPVNAPWQYHKVQGDADDDASFKDFELPQFFEPSQSEFENLPHSSQAFGHKLTQPAPGEWWARRGHAVTPHSEGHTYAEKMV